MPSVDEHLDALFENLPRDPRERLDAVKELTARFRERAAEHLQPAIRQIVRQSEDLPHAQKGDVCRDVNEALHDARVAFVNPVSQMPAMLARSISKPTSNVSRFYLQDTRAAPDGRRHMVRINSNRPASALRLAAFDDESRGR